MPHSITVDYSDLLRHAVEMHYADINAAVRRRGLSGNAASDVVHDLYVKLAERPDVLEGKHSVRAFLCRAAINLGIDRLRRRRFEQRLFSGSAAEALAVPTDTAPPGYALDVTARLTILRTAIAELPPRRRAVFILHRLHSLEPAEIAVRLRISRNMVDRHLRHALAHCLDCLLRME